MLTGLKVKLCLVNIFIPGEDLGVALFPNPVPSRPVPLMRLAQDERLNTPRVREWKVDQSEVVVRSTRVGHDQDS